MATIQEKIRENKIVSCKFKSCLGRDENGKQIFKCYTWYPPVGLTKAKCRKEAERAAAVWEAEVKQAYALQKEQEAEAESAKVYTFGRFVNEVWLPLCVRDGSHRPATIAMYTNILKLILLRFEAVPLHEITGIQISQYLTWLRNEYRTNRGQPLAEKSIRHHYNILSMIFNYAERQDVIVKNPMKKVDAPKVSKKAVDALTEKEAARFFAALVRLKTSMLCGTLLLYTHEKYHVKATETGGNRMKRILSFILVMVMLCCVMPTAFAASDEATSAADKLHSLGLFNGTGTDANGDPIFDLDRAPTRHEAVTMLVRLLGKGEEALGGTWEMPFTDVADWAQPYVGYAYANGLTSGTSATTFGGDSLVTASQYLTFVLRALGYDSSTDFKWDAAWELSDELGFTSGEYSTETKTFLRGDVAIISCAALNAKLKNEETLLVQSLVSNGAVDEAAAMERGFDIYGLTENVHFIYDIRTFTLYAFMNYTGYDDNNGRPITGARAALRSDLAAMDIDISSPDYFTRKYTSNNVREFDYAAALLCLGAAPDFTYYNGGSVHPSLSDLPAKLSEFYAAANIPTLYEKYRADHDTILSQYKEALPDIVKMVCYFGAQNDVEGEFGVEVVLLDAWNRGTGLGSADKYYGYGVIRTGPAAGVNTLNILHEYGHGFVNRALDSNKSQMSALSGYFDRNCKATKQGYDTWTGITYESFVRAISTYFDSSLTEGLKAKVIKDDVALGFVMTQYVYDRIPEFENFDGDFNAFIRMLLVEYPQYA